MKNLLHTELTEGDLAGLLAEARDPRMLPPLGARNWTMAARKPAVSAWLAGIRRRAEQEAFHGMPPLTDELYSDFHHAGRRLAFENVYFERRRLLARMALTVLLSDEAAREWFISDLVEKIRDIADEPSWALPAHVDDPSGKDPRALDLFAAETANLMGEMLTVFGAIIPPALAGRIRARLRREVFENYVERHASLGWVRAGMNWNAVCHQGILGAALAVEEDPAVLARLLMLAREGLPHFLAGFGDDGSTSEGPAYWQYGFGWFTELNAQLEARTAGALSLFEGDEKVERIAHFAPHLVFRNGYFVNFSDGGRRGILRAPLVAYLGERLKSDFLRTRAAASYQRLASEGLDLEEQRTDFFYLSRLVLRCPGDTGVVPSPRERADPADGLAVPIGFEDGTPLPQADVFFPDYEAVVARGPDARGHYWEFAAKAGSNAEHHNHNDCGSFILHVNGEPVVTEIGAPEYVRDYFGEGRYSFLAARSAGHSVPLVNGHEQSAGAAFAAEVIKCEMTTDRVEFVVDLAKCYPPEARCRRLIRSFILEKHDGRLTVTDAAEFDGEGVLESLLISEAPVTIGEGRACIETPSGPLHVTPHETTATSALDAPEYRNHHGIASSVNRLRLRTASPATFARLVYSIEPAAREATPSIRPGSS